MAKLFLHKSQTTTVGDVTTTYELFFAASLSPSKSCLVRKTVEDTSEGTTIVTFLEKVYGSLDSAWDDRTLATSKTFNSDYNFPY